MKVVCLAVFLLIISTNSTSAECLQDEQTFMSCTIEQSDTRLRVCFTDTDATYRYGQTDASPDLELSTPIAAVNYVPWPGIGRTIFEIVRFENGDYTYEVHAGFARSLEVDTGTEISGDLIGGVKVLRDEEIVTHRSCAAETINFAWDEGLYAAKIALGLEWDRQTGVWRTRND